MCTAKRTSKANDNAEIFTGEIRRCVRPEICDKGGHKDETQLAVCLFLKLSDGDSLHYYIDF